MGEKGDLEQKRSSLYGENLFWQECASYQKRTIGAYTRALLFNRRARPLSWLIALDLTIWTRNHMHFLGRVHIVQTVADNS